MIQLPIAVDYLGSGKNLEYREKRKGGGGSCWSGNKREVLQRPICLYLEQTIPQTTETVIVLYHCCAQEQGT